MRRTFLTMAMTLFSVFLVLNLFTRGSINDSHLFYLLILFIGGIGITSHSFLNVHNELKAYSFFMLPCSISEKFFAKLLISSMGYIFFSLVLYSCFSFLIGMMSIVLFQHEIPVFNPFQMELRLDIRNYLICQAVFFMGAIYFNKHVVFKTLFWSSLILLVLTFCSFVFSWVVCRSCFSGNFFIIPEGGDYFLSITEMLKTAFWFGLAPFCWVVTYFRLKESEVRS